MRVADLSLVRPLYDALFTALGLTKINDDAGSVGYHRPDEGGTDPFVWLVEEREHQAGGTRIAFAAPARSEVDRLAQVAHSAGARAFEAPHLVTEYGADYYAAFFEDAQGNKLEICCRRPE